MKICPIAIRCQSRFNILTNTKNTNKNGNYWPNLQICKFYSHLISFVLLMTLSQYCQTMKLYGLKDADYPYTRHGSKMDTLQS